MANILALTDFINQPKFYGIPDLRADRPSDANKLNASIDFAERKFLSEYNLTSAVVSASNDLKEALKYYTFAEWLRAEWLLRTPSGASVEKTQIKGTPKYDLTREVQAKNMAIDLINTALAETLETPYSHYLPFLNY